MTRRSQSIRRIRRQDGGGMNGYIVTWDADSRDMARCSRLKRLVFGYDLRRNGTSRHYPGLIDSRDVLYLGQSVLLVKAALLPVLRDFLRTNRIDHAIRTADVGNVMPG